MPPATILPDGLEWLPITDWENGHQNFKHRFKADASFKLRIPLQTNNRTEQYRQTTRNFQWLIQYALDHQLRLRAMGNGWSFSDVMVCDGGMVDTKALRLSFWIPQAYIHPNYLATGKGPGDLFFAQCGMSILDIHEKLEQQASPKRSLRASGASNGQSIAGATSTGTHGAAFRVGAVHDTILGIHLVVGPDRHIWLERASAPVAGDAFVNWLQAELVRDDTLFHAALVSFGSFGFIHGILLETEPVYLLAEQRADQQQYDDELEQAMSTLDFSVIDHKLPYPANGTDRELYHFEVIINPHQFEKNNKDKGVYLKTMYKIPYYEGYPKRPPVQGNFQYGEHTLGVIQTIVDLLPDTLQALLVPALVNQMFPLAFKKATDAVGTIGETFTNPKFRGKATSCAVGVDAAHAPALVDLIIDLNRHAAFPGGLALRFVKGSQALLAFTRFEKTCVLELDGVESNTSREFFQKVWERMEAMGIPYTLHWGKMNFNLNPIRLRSMYGDARVAAWINARHQLLAPAVREVFTNALMQRCGLDQ